jgi:opacity protein-like surface antigen
MKFKIALAAAAVAGLAGTAQAADLAKKAPAAADYVKVCDAYGAGFFYIPGSETCLKIGGYVRVELLTGSHSATLGGVGVSLQPVTNPGMKIGGNRNDTALNTRVRVDVTLDARTNTELGLLRSYIELRDTINSGNAGSNTVDVFQGFIQFAGLTVGRASSFFDFVEGSYNLGNRQELDAATDHRLNLFAYTFSFGNGISATLSLEDFTTTDGTSMLRGPYSAVKMPDVVANVAIAQAWGRAQVMAALHQDYTSAAVSGADKDKLGYAFGAGVEVNLPMLGAGDKIFVQGTYAKGAVGYVLNNAGGYVGGVAPIDFFVNAGGNISQSTAWGVAGGISHNFSKQVEANLGASYASYQDNWNSVAVPENDFKQVVVNAEVKWKPVAGLAITPAVEYRWVDYKSAAIANGSSWVGYVRVQRNF